MPCRSSRRLTARLILIASLAGATLAGSLATGVAAQYDPSRPTNNRQALPPGGGGGGGEPERRVTLGVATPYGRDLEALDSLTNQLGGRRPAMWAVWSQWGNDTTREFPLATAYELRARGVVPVIWWEPVISNDLSNPLYARHRNITSGQHDSYILRFAREAKEFGTTVVLRFAHEANHDMFPWSVNNFDNSPQTFIAAWRHVHAIFQWAGADNVKFLWSVARQACQGGCNPYEGVYPGDAYVDAVGFSGYNWGTVGDKNWVSMVDIYRRPVELFREFTNKPIVVAETGSNSVGGDKAAWIRDGYRQVYDQLPEIRSIMYLNADLRSIGHPDWRLASPQSALAAYAEIAGLERFSGRNPFGARRKLARVDAGDRPGKAERRDDRKADRKADRQRREARQDEPADSKPPRERKPRVHRGSEADGPGDGGDESSARAENRESKRRKPTEEPPAVLGTFSR